MDSLTTDSDATRDFIQERIRVLTESIHTARRSKEGNQTDTAKASFESMIRSMEMARQELRYVLSHNDTGEIHPDLDSKWTTQVVGHK